ncbi:MAG: flavin reductase family protein [Candidatus Eisenbacteria sp.]|nr:flavin reductase family protein [Candidatus Eisenbacteria bacterium]
MAKYSSQFPDPVILVTVTTEKETNFMTVGWASPVSFAPPILMVSIAPGRHTHDLILKAGEFGVSILADDQKELATLGGTTSGRDVDKPAQEKVEILPGEEIRAPHIAGARAWLECKVVSHHTVGDHTVFYGKVVRTVADESKSALVLFNRVYYALGEERGVYP